MTTARSAALALLLVASSGCSNRSLDGSLSDAFDLSFSSLDLRRSSTAFQVSYLRSEGREVVARITVVTEGLDMSSSFQLGGEYAAGHPRASVTRAMDREPLLVLPPVASGEMDAGEDPKPGKSISGDFSLVFGDGGDVGAGRTLYGNFEGTVLAAD